MITEFFDPYSGRDEQIIASAAARMIELKVSPADVIDLYEQRIADRVAQYNAANTQSSQRSQSRPSSPALGVCPACGKNHYGPVANAEGLKIMGCTSCRFSAITGEADG